MTPVTTPVQSESEEEEEEQEPLPIKSPYQRKKEQEKAVRATSLKEIIEDLKNQIETINTKEIPALVEEKNKASKEFTKAKNDWEEEYPRSPRVVAASAALAFLPRGKPGRMRIAEASERTHTGFEATPRPPGDVLGGLPEVQAKPEP